MFTGARTDEQPRPGHFIVQAHSMASQSQSQSHLSRLLDKLHALEEETRASLKTLMASQRPAPPPTAAGMPGRWHAGQQTPPLPKTTREAQRKSVARAIKILHGGAVDKSSVQAARAHTHQQPSAHISRTPSTVKLLNSHQAKQFAKHSKKPQSSTPAVWRISKPLQGAQPPRPALAAVESTQPARPAPTSTAVSSSSTALQQVPALPLPAYGGRAADAAMTAKALSDKVLASVKAANTLSGKAFAKRAVHKPAEGYARLNSMMPSSTSRPKPASRKPPLPPAADFEAESTVPPRECRRDCIGGNEASVDGLVDCVRCFLHRRRSTGSNLTALASGLLAAQHVEQVAASSSLGTSALPTSSPSLWLEFGAWSGKSTRLIRDAASAVQAGMPVYSFDSFEGLPEDWREDPRHRPNLTAAFLSRGSFSRQGIPPFHEQGIHWEIGWFNETLGPFLARHQHEPVRMLHIDCDLYSSTDAVFRRVEKRLAPDAIIVFDELCGAWSRPSRPWRPSAVWRLPLPSAAATAVCFLHVTPNGGRTATLAFAGSTTQSTEITRPKPSSSSCSALGETTVCWARALGSSSAARWHSVSCSAGAQARDPSRRLAASRMRMWLSNSLRPWTLQGHRLLMTLLVYSV